MKKIYITFLFLFPLMLFSQSNISIDKHNPLYNVILTKDKGEKLLNQCSRAVPSNITDYFDLEKENISLLENNFKKLLKVKAKDCCLIGGKIDSLDNYAFQYIGVIINNRKYIYINAFYIETENDFSTWYKNWTTEPVIVCDGGDSFWGVLFDLKSHKFSHLAINGIA
jgi:hypothetical protein